MEYIRKNMLSLCPICFYKASAPFYILSGCLLKNCDAFVLSALIRAEGLTPQRRASELLIFLLVIKCLFLLQYIQKFPLFKETIDTESVLKADRLSGFDTPTVF